MKLNNFYCIFLIIFFCASCSKNISKEIDEIYHSILIKSSLKLSKGNKTEAAKILGWGRNTLSKKMKEHGI